MGRITGNSNPLDQSPQEFQPASSNPQTVQPPLNPLPSWRPPAAASFSPAKPQPSFHQPPPPPPPPQLPVRYPPMYYQHHQVSVGSNNQYPIVVAQTPNVRPEDWKTGLFDCMDDPSNAAMTFFCPCVTFGQIAEIVDEGHTLCGTSGMLYGLVAFCTGLPCLISFAYRTKLRSQYGLVESPAADSVVHLFCDWCALCQEYRELQLRGIDPSIGWLGNVAKNQSIPQQYAMMPPISQTMNG